MNHESLTTAEIKARYPDEWVLIGDPVKDEDAEVVGGIVLFHSRDRDETSNRALELRPKHSAIYYTGATPEDTEFVL